MHVFKVIKSAHLANVFCKHVVFYELLVTYELNSASYVPYAI